MADKRPPTTPGNAPEEFALTLPEPPGAALSLEHLVPFSFGRTPITEERRVIDELRTQTTVQASTAAKALFANEQFRRIHEHATATLDETLSQIVATQEQGGRSAAHQRYIDQFCQKQAQMAIGHFFGGLDVAARNIALEVNRSLYPDLIPERPRGLLERIFGPAARA
jgi:hypothetical protein